MQAPAQPEESCGVSFALAGKSLGYGRLRHCSTSRGATNLHPGGKCKFGSSGFHQPRPYDAHYDARQTVNPVCWLHLRTPTDAACDVYGARVITWLIRMLNHMCIQTTTFVCQCTCIQKCVNVYIYTYVYVFGVCVLMGV